MESFNSQEFATNAEAAVCRMLKQVIANHLVTQGLSFHAALGTAGLLLVESAQSLCGPGAEVDVLVSHTCTWLKAHVRTRYTVPAFPDITMEMAPPSKMRVLEDVEALQGTLGHLLREASEEQELGLEGRFRITRSLMADLLSVLLHHLALTPEDVDAFIEESIRATLSRYLPRPPR